MYECNRCGACCISGPCQSGIENDDGVCKFLIINKDNTTSCEKILDGTMNLNHIGLNKGCNLQKLPDIYLYYKNQANSYKSEMNA